MGARQELLERLRVGLPVDEAGPLLERVRREEALECAPKTNPFYFRDPQVQRFSDLWFSQRETATVGQKDQVGIAYLVHVLGLSEEVARRFVEGDVSAEQKVGMRQSGIPLRVDTSEFWTEVGRIFPGTYSEGDRTFLMEKGGTMIALHLLSHLEVPQAEDSSVLQKLAVNAHAYK